MAVIDQINVRVDPAVKAEFDAIAATLDSTGAALIRELLEEKMPELRERAVAAAAQRGKWPAAIPAAAVEQEILSLARSIARSEPLSVVPRDVLSARGRAMLQLLTWIWQGAEDAAGGAKVGKKVEEWLDAVSFKDAVKSAEKVDAATGGVYIPPAKPVKDYPRRGS
jgi:hypothetical protein